MKISAAEAGANFEMLADRALTEPITITKSGHDHLVLMSAAEYMRLKRRDRQVYRVEDLPDDLVEVIAKAEPPPESEAFNHEYDPTDGR